jgi:hypothetical protein
MVDKEKIENEAAATATAIPPRRLAPVLRSVMMQMLRDRPGYPKGFLVSVPSGLFDVATGDLVELTGTAREWRDKKIAAPVVVPLPGQTGEEPAPDVKILLCAEKIFDSPAYYPGDVFGVDPELAAKYIERKAAHVATADDLRKFYDPNRGLLPNKQTKPPQTSAALAFAADRAAAQTSRERTAQAEAEE